MAIIYIRIRSSISAALGNRTNNRREANPFIAFDLVGDGGPLTCVFHVLFIAFDFDLWTVEQIVAL